MKSNEKMMITIVANLLSIAVSVFVSFFITQYFVEFVGKEAYSYYPIATNFSTYFSILFVITSTVSSRLVIVNYLNKNTQEAKEYYSTTFLSCVIISVFIFLVEMIFYSNLTSIVNVSNELVHDVKLLFLYIFLATICNGICAVFNISYYVKNRMDLYGISLIIESLVKGTLMIYIYLSKNVSLSSLGLIIFLSTIIRSLFSVFVSIKEMRDIKLDMKLISKSKFKKIFNLGVWSIISNSGNLLIINSELIIANRMLPIEESSVLSLVQPIMTMCLLLGNTISSMIEPIMIRGVINNDQNEVNVATNAIVGLIIIPIVLIMCLNKQLYSLWLPNEDSSKLFVLTFLICLQLLISFIAYENSSSITTLLKEKVKGIGFGFTLIVYILLLKISDNLFTFTNELILACGIVAYLLYFVIYIPFTSKKLLINTHKQIQINNLKKIIFTAVIIISNLLISKTFPLGDLLMFILMSTVCLVLDYALFIICFKIDLKKLIKKQ